MMMRVKPILYGKISSGPSSLLSLLCFGCSFGSRLDRYGHSKESEERINEIDAKLAEFEQERARYLLPTSESEQQQHEEPHSETSQRLPQIVSGKGASTSVASASVAVAVSRPEKVIGDSYLKEQKMATIRRKYSQQLDLLLSLVHSQVPALLSVSLSLFLSFLLSSL
jgi:hypothetical protein